MNTPLTPSPLRRLLAASRHAAVASAGAIGRALPPVARSRRRLAVAALGLLAGAALLASLSGTPTGVVGPGQPPGSHRPLGPLEDVARDGEGVDRSVSTAVAPAGLGGGISAVPWGRRIIRHGMLTVEVGDVDHTIARLMALVEAAGGYVADTETHADDRGVARATVTAYVPPEGFARALRDLEGLGRATARRVTGQDVSEEFVDLEARVRNLERHEAQLLSFMSRAHKVADLLSLEAELARVRGEIERLTGRLRFLRARTEMAAIRLSLSRAPLAGAPDGALARAWGEVSRAFLRGWDAAFGVAVGLAALGAQLSPLLLPVAALWALYRRRTRGEPAGA